MRSPSQNRHSRLAVAACGLLVLLLSLLPGCAMGLLYRHTVEPLTVNFKRTPVGDVTGKGDVKDFRYYVEVQWDENAIGEIARQHGLKEVDYADLEVLSVVGIWTQRFVHVYGR